MYEHYFQKDKRHVILVSYLYLTILNGHWFTSLRVRCYRIVSLRERVELEPLDKSPLRTELSSVEILLVEGISDLKEYSISVSLLLRHKKRGRKTNITAVRIYSLLRKFAVTGYIYIYGNNLKKQYVIRVEIL